MAYDIKHSAADEKYTGPTLEQQQQQIERFALAMGMPLIKRILLAILPIKMGRPDEAPGLVQAPVAARGETTIERPREVPPRSPRQRGTPNGPKDPLGFLEGKVPFKVRTDLKIEGDNIVRFDVQQRIQHILMFTSFLTLAFTGLPQKTHAWPVSQGIIAALGGLEMTQTIHHFAAFVMLFDISWHLAYVLVGVIVFKRMAPLGLIPNLKDVKDAIMQFNYFLGLSDKQPKFDRYSYLEKFDYWAVAWGMVAIGGTGIIMMFPVLATKILPGQIIPVALVAHSDEAVLAVGWIFVVHLFYAHLVPRIFPFNTSIFTGRVSKKRYIEEHTLDWELMIARQERAARVQHEALQPAAATGAKRQISRGQSIKLVGTPSGGAVLEVEELADSQSRHK